MSILKGLFIRVTVVCLIFIGALAFVGCAKREQPTNPVVPQSKVSAVDAQEISSDGHYEVTCLGGVVYFKNTLTPMYKNQSTPSTIRC